MGTPSTYYIHLQVNMQKCIQAAFNLTRWINQYNIFTVLFPIYENYQCSDTWHLLSSFTSLSSRGASESPWHCSGSQPTFEWLICSERSGTQCSNACSVNIYQIWLNELMRGALNEDATQIVLIKMQVNWSTEDVHASWDPTLLPTSDALAL